MSRTRKYPGYKYLLASVDWATMVAASLGALLARGRWEGLGPEVLSDTRLAELGFVAAYACVAILVFQQLNLYKINVFITLIDHTVRLVKGLTLVVLGLALFSFFVRVPWIVDSRLAILYFALLSFGLLLVVRVILFRKLFLWLSRSRVIQRRVLIVGGGKTGRELAINLSWPAATGHHVVGFLDDELTLGHPVFAGARVLGRIADLQECVRATGAEEIIISLDTTEYAHLMEVMELAVATRVLVKIASPLYDVIPSRLFIERYGSIPVVGVSQSQPRRVDERVKRIFDLALTIPALILLSPVLALFAALIKLDSPGPVIYRQTRLGKNGKPFTFYKFRSMRVQEGHDELHRENVTKFILSRKKADPQAATSNKIVDEERVTRVGRWLRRTSLDELPQLFNVLKGDMSLVGPRPCLPYEWEHYEEWHKRRLSVLPGCTGMWQVSGRSMVGFDDMVVLDLYYIQNSSILLDLRLLLKTIPVMVFGEGAK